MVWYAATWRRIQVEVSPDEGSAGSISEPMRPPSLSGFGLPTPDHLVGLALSYQIAQKIHASTDPHDPPTTLNDRVRDIVDLIPLRDLSAETEHPTNEEVHADVANLFRARGREAESTGGTPREWPVRLAAHPYWKTAYESAANSVSIPIALDEAVRQVNQWLDGIEESA